MNQQKKINVLVIPDLFPKFAGDVQGIFILDYLKATQPNCCNTVVFGRLHGSKKDLTTEKIHEATILRFFASSQKIPSFLKPLFYLRWFIKGYQIGKTLTDTDIIHAHGTILSGTLSYLLSKKLKVPFIITEHQGPFSMTSENVWKRNWTRIIMQRANMVLTVSEHLKQEILNAGIHPKSILTTYNPVDTALFKVRPKLDYKKILFAGRLDNFKGALRCVKAFEKIASQFPGWRFTIIGDGEDFLPIKKYIEENKSLKELIQLKGQQSKAEISEEMQRSSFLVFPSRHESFGLVIAEALSCGMPVIVGNLTAPKEFVKKESGILVPPDDLEAISNAMNEMIIHYSNYDSEWISKQIHEHFGFENFGKKIIDIYQSQLNKS